MESHPARLQIKNRVSGIPLRKDGLLLRKENSSPALADSGEERTDVELADVLGCAEFRVLRDIESVCVWRVNFVERLGSQGEAMGAPPPTPCSKTSYHTSAL